MSKQKKWPKGAQILCAGCGGVNGVGGQKQADGRILCPNCQLLEKKKKIA